MRGEGGVASEADSNFWSRPLLWNCIHMTVETTFKYLLLSHTGWRNVETKNVACLDTDLMFTSWRPGHCDQDSTENISTLFKAVETKILRKVFLNVFSSEVLFYLSIISNILRFNCFYLHQFCQFVIFDFLPWIRIIFTLRANIGK